MPTKITRVPDWLAGVLASLPACPASLLACKQTSASSLYCPTRVLGCPASSLGVRAQFLMGPPRLRECPVGTLEIVRALQVSLLGTQARGVVNTASLLGALASWLACQQACLALRLASRALP